MTARDRLQAKRDDLSTRRRMLATALSPDLVPSSSSSSSSSSPAPHAPRSPPNVRPSLGQRKLSGTPPSQTPTMVSRPGSSARQVHPSPAAAQVARSVSTSAQVNRGAGATAASPPGVQAPFPRRGHPHTNEVYQELTKQIDEAQFQLSALSDTIARARSGLVQELVEVFSVVEVRTFITLTVLLINKLCAGWWPSAAWW